MITHDYLEGKHADWEQRLADLLARDSDVAVVPVLVDNDAAIPQSATNESQHFARRSRRMPSAA